MKYFCVILRFLRQNFLILGIYTINVYNHVPFDLIDYTIILRYLLGILFSV